MYLVAGLGNPGPKFAEHRHNVGFRVVDELARRAAAGERRSKFGGELAQAEVGGQRVLLLKPQEFMNLSGRAVARARAFYQIESARLVVVHDDIDLEFGRLRLKQGGGHGGHNGVRSMVADLGTDDFVRVRVGIGRPSERDVTGHVLSQFSKAESEELPLLIGRAADAVEEILRAGISSAMNKFNTALAPCR